MNEILNITMERVDDIPLLVGLFIRINLPVIIDRYLEKHGNHKGLSNGWLITVWLAYILSAGDHRKSHVRDWSRKHKHTLEQLTGQSIRDADFSDDRLGAVLTRLSDREKWEAIEADLWLKTARIYSIEMNGVRLDSTGSYGYHRVNEDGLMQFGHSKDHRPDLPQLKLMAAVTEPGGLMIASDVHPGQNADDPLYLPLINRVRQILNRTGLLYTGDSKMAALATRAELVFRKDHYLVPLPLTGETTEFFNNCVSQTTDGDRAAELIYNSNGLFGFGCEFPRNVSAVVEDEEIEWTERVLLVRSRNMAFRDAQSLERNLQKAEKSVQELTPPRGRGKRQFTEEAALQEAVEKILRQYGVSDLLHVTRKREEESHICYVGRGRGGPNRPARTEVRVRYVITGICRDEAAVKTRQHRMGWRLYGTDLFGEHFTLPALVLHYNGGYCIERDFHILKDKPLGIRPLFVRKDNQIVGLTHLLTMGLRVMILIETQVRKGIADSGESMSGLYEGQSNRSTDQPTAKRLLNAFAREEISMSCVDIAGQTRWHITPLPDLLVRILALLGFSTDLYTRLTENSS